MIPAVFLFYRHAQHGRERVVLAPALAGRAGRKLFGGQPARRQPHESPSFPQAALGKFGDCPTTHSPFVTESEQLADNFEQTELRSYLTVAHIRREKSGEKAVGPCLEFCWPTTTMLSAICCM